jgi:hypothetical protein
MFTNFQTVKQQMASIAIVAGGNNVVKLRDLATQLDGRFAHLVGFEIEVALTPAYTTTPTQVGLRNVLNLIEFFDGRQIRTRATGNSLRQHNRLEFGKQVGGDPKIAAAMTGNPRYLRMWLGVGPAAFAGSPSDFALCNALLMNGELRINIGQLTDISADCTAISGTIIVTAVHALLDEVRLPPFYERQTYQITSDDRLGGKGLYASVGVSKSTAYGAFAAGEYGTALLETGTFSVVPNVNASILASLFNHEMANGAVGGVQGEPINATHDTNQRDPDYSGVTALLAGIADLQPLLFCAPGCRISKIAARVDNAMRIKSSGSVTSGLLAHVGRFLPQAPDVIDALQQEVERQLNISTTARPKTISKSDYKGPYVAYMPWALKVKR